MNHPDGMPWAAVTTVRADGTFSYDQRQYYNDYIGHSQIKKINGYVTMEAFDSSGKSVVIPATTSAGYAYTGSY